MKNLTFIQKCFTILLAASILFVAQNNIFAQAGDDLWAGFDNKPFDFSDEFYQHNGIKFDKIIERRTGADFLSVFDNPANDTKFRNVRVLVTVTGYDHEGNMIFWNPLGELNDDGFTENRAGMELKTVAEGQLMYVFPRNDGSSYALNNNRQSSIIDLQGYASYQNVLGLRRVVLVSYTKAAFNTNAGKEMLWALHQRNGLAADRTPIVKTVGEIKRLVENGFATLRKPPVENGKSGLFAISPVIADPQNGAIARDAFLWYVRQESGKPIDAENKFVYQFECLRNYGTWCVQ